MGDGDRRRFEQFYGHHYEMILAYALRRTSTEDAADVVAETFLTAWRRWSAVPEGDAARLWLYGVARKVLANRLRSTRRWERLHARLRAEPPPSGPAYRDGPVTEAFGRLRRADREVLTLTAVEGLSPAEAAVVLRISASAARVRLHRARERFARALTAAGVTGSHLPATERPRTMPPRTEPPGTEPPRTEPPRTERPVTTAGGADMKRHTDERRPQ